MAVNRIQTSSIVERNGTMPDIERGKRVLRATRIAHFIMRYSRLLCVYAMNKYIRNFISYIAEFNDFSVYILLHIYNIHS